MPRLSLVRYIQMSTAIERSKNRTSVFTNSGSSYPLVNTTEKGHGFDTSVSTSSEIIEKYDDFTFKFKKPGIYKIEFRITAVIDENNDVGKLIVRPSVSNNITQSGHFPNFSDYGIGDTEIQVKYSENSDARYVDKTPISDYRIYTYNGNEDVYFKLILFGPTGSSNIQPGAILSFTYLSS